MVMTCDLVLRVLTAVEDQTPHKDGLRDLLVDGEKVLPNSDLEEAAQYCIERGFIELWDHQGRPMNLIKRLTAAGHDKLRELRGQKRI